VLDVDGVQLFVFCAQHREVARIGLDTDDARKRKTLPLASTDDAVDERTRSTAWVKQSIARPGGTPPK
jgi:hypothetical protein